MDQNLVGGGACDFHTQSQCAVLCGTGGTLQLGFCSAFFFYAQLVIGVEFAHGKVESRRNRLSWLLLD